MSDNLINNIDDSDIDYTIVVKNMDDIISGITIDPKEKLIYESIIDNLERNAADTIRNNKIAGLPAIGAIRKSFVQQVIRNNHKTFSIIRKHLSKEDYAAHVKDTIIMAKENERLLDRQKELYRLAKSRNKKRYDEIYIKVGKANAELFIYSILYLKEVPYINEVQEHYDRLNGLL